MRRDAKELANELIEQFGFLTKEHALKIAATEHLPTTPIPNEAISRALEDTGRIPDRFVITKTNKTETQVYREARLFGCVRKAEDYLRPPERFKEQVDGFQEKGMQRAWLFYNGVSRIRWLTELVDSGELWLEADGGERLELTEWKFYLLYKSKRYNTLCLRLKELGNRTLRLRRDPHVAGLFWEAA